MKIQPAKNFSSKTSIREAEAGPLLKRMARWSTWAEKMARRFGPKPRRLPLLTRIFRQQRAAVLYGRAPINYHWHLKWQPIFQWRWSAAAPADNRPGKIRPRDEKIGERQGWSDRQPWLNMEMSRYRRTESTPIATIDRGRYRLPPMIDPTPAPSPTRPAPGLPLETVFKGRQFKAVGAIIQRANTLQGEKPVQLARQLSQPRRRVEALPRQARSIDGQPLALQRDAVLPRADFSEPAAPIFRQSKIAAGAVPSPTTQVQMGTVPASAPFNNALPPLVDLNKLTDQVMQQIDRRMTIWRERTGRV